MKKFNCHFFFLAMAIILCVFYEAKAQCPTSVSYDGNTGLFTFTYSSGIPSGTYKNLDVTISEGKGIGNHTLSITNKTATTFNTDNDGGTIDGSSIASLIDYSGGSGGVSCNTLTPLPVTLTSFNGLLLTNTVILNWATATEVNNERFDIERSMNGIEFEKIGVVKGKGNSNQVENYSFEDNSVNELSNPYMFYRLKQVDFNGKFEYSNIILIKKPNSTPSVCIYPNPANTTLTIEQKDAELLNNTLQIIGMDGKVFIEMQINEKLAMVDISILNKGIYYVKIISNDISQILEVQKIIIK